jgi:hypothetical protein
MKALDKALFLKAIAIAVCLGFISLSVYGFVQVSEKNTPDPNLKNFLKKPVHLISSLVGTIASSGEISDSSYAFNSNSKQKTKITHNLKCDKINDQD